MMNYPPNPSQSDYPFSETFEHLVQIRQALLKLLISNSVAQDLPLKHSLFSSEKKYRKDELHLGLVNTAGEFHFSLN